MCASWLPAGLAFKLPEAEVNKLIASAKTKPLKYFEKGHENKAMQRLISPGMKRA